MSDQTRKRLKELTKLLLNTYPDGISTPEIAEILGVTRQTAHKDIQRLQNDHVPIFEPNPQRYAINPRDYIRPLRLTLPQAWMLYLPLRRMVRAQMHDHHVVYSLLQRLTLAFDPVIAERLIPETSTTPSPNAAQTFVRLVDAWRDHKWVAINYKPLNKSASRHLIAPYWFEPAVWSDSLYVIAGLKNRHGTSQPVALKLDRIQSANIRSDTFDFPEPNDILDMLKHTWGIWDGDEPVRVRLRFHNRQRQRLLETKWHPTESLSDQEDGSVIWTGIISEPQEMMPWIRGWGPDVEVLEPQSLREQIAIDADRTARQYGFCDEDVSGSFLSLRKPQK